MIYDINGRNIGAGNTLDEEVYRMAFQYGATLRNNQTSQIQTTIGASGTLKIFSGAEPANCAAGDPAGLLATIVLLTITDAAAGKCTITVFAETTELLGGIYTDIIGIISGGVRSTLSRGSISVAACPWLAQYYKPISSGVVRMAA